MNRANLLTTREAATYLGVSQSRVQQLLRAGRILPYWLAGRVYLIDRRAVQRFGRVPRPPGPRRGKGRGVPC